GRVAAADPPPTRPADGLPHPASGRSWPTGSAAVATFSWSYLLLFRVLSFLRARPRSGRRSPALWPIGPGSGCGVCTDQGKPRARALADRAGRAITDASDFLTEVNGKRTIAPRLERLVQGIAANCQTGSGGKGLTADCQSAWRNWEQEAERAGWM